MNRRRFLKLLAAVPLVLDLHLPVDEDELKPAWEGYVNKITVTDRGLKAIQACDAEPYAIWIYDDSWWVHGTDGTIWMSDDIGDTWWFMGTEEPGMHWSV